MPGYSATGTREKKSKGAVDVGATWRPVRLHDPLMKVLCTPPINRSPLVKLRSDARLDAVLPAASLHLASFERARALQSLVCTYIG